MADSFVTVEDFKDNTGIELEDDIIETGLKTTAKEIQRKLFIKRNFETQQQDTKYILFTPVADRNMDGQVDASDLDVYEVDSEYKETDIHQYIDVFRPKYGFLKFSTTVPITNGNKLRFEYKTAIAPNEELFPQMQDLNTMMAVNYLFRRVPFSKLQEGISSWTLNGVTVNFDEAVMKAVRDSNDETIKQMMRDLTPYYSKNPDLGYAKDDLNRNSIRATSTITSRTGVRFVSNN